MPPTTRLSVPWLFRALCATLVLAPAAPAFGQDIATAEALFDKGVADMKAGRYEAGCKAIGESQRLDPRPGTLFAQATCEAEWGRIATAAARYGDYMSVYERLPPDKQADPKQSERYKVAAEMRAKLQADVPQLTLSLPKGAPAGTVVKRDGQVVAEAALGVALPVDPGEHTIGTQGPDGGVREQKISLAKGEKKAVILEVPSNKASDPKPPAPPDSPPSSRSYVGPLVAFGAGAVGLGVGVAFGAVAIGKRGELESACPDHECPAAEQGRIDETRTLSHISTAGFVLAGVGAAVGVVLLLLPPPGGSKPKKVGIAWGVGRAGLEGTF